VRLTANRGREVFFGMEAHLGRTSRISLFGTIFDPAEALLEEKGWA
jgi:hypothetical protein